MTLQATGERPEVLHHPFPVIEEQVAMVMDGWSADPDRVVPGLTAIVNALASKGGWTGNRWQVLGSGSEEVTVTTYDRQRCFVTLAPLLDERLTPDQRSAVLLSILLHEVGHVRGSEPYTATMLHHARTVGGRSGWSQHNRERGYMPLTQAGRRWAQQAQPFSNLLEDVRTEADTVATFGAYGPVLDLCRWWIVSRHPVLRVSAPKYRDEAWGFAVAVIRYREHVDLATDARTKRETAWWQAWGARWAIVDPDQRIEGLTEAIDRIKRMKRRPEPEDPGEPEPGPTSESEDRAEDEGEGGSDEGDPEDEDGESGESGGDQPDDEGSPTEGTGPGDDEPEDGESGGEVADESEPDGGDGDESDEGTQPEQAAVTAGRDGDDEGDGPEPPDFGDEDGADAPDGDDEGSPTEGEADMDEHEGTGSDDAPTVDHGAFGNPDGPALPEPEPKPETLPLHADGDLTEVERADAADLATAQVISAGTRKRITVRWALPPEVPEVVAPRDAMVTPVDAPPVDPNAERRQAEYVARGGMASSDGDAISVEVDVIDLARIRADVQGQVMVDTAGVNAMRQAFRMYRNRADAPIIGHTGRKIDQRRVHRLGADDGRVFIRSGGQSADRLDVHLLVDRSGSMGGYGPRSRIGKARTMLATIAQAMEAEHHVRLTFWSESNSSMIGRNSSRAARDLQGDRVTHSEVVRHWSTDEGMGAMRDRVGALAAGGGFHDASAIEAVARMVDHQPDRRPVLIVLSDGEPIEPMGWVHQVVTRARRQGVAVFGVGMAEGLTAKHIEMYGRQSLVPFTGDWTALGRGIMRVIARLLP